MNAPLLDPAYRVLLVEDDPGDALLVEELLLDTGLEHSLAWQQTLATAVRHLSTNGADCVLLDLNLPDATGMSALGALQTVRPETAIIVLTGLDESRAGALAVANGAQDYLVKGQVSPDLLTRVIRYAVHRKQAERAAAELRENRLRAHENTRLERGLLPTPLLHGSPVTAATRYLPGRERALLGGDFLDVVRTPDGTVHAVIGDVSGHGPDEAALGVCLRITWRALTLGGHRGSDLLHLLEEVLIAERVPADNFATCTILELRPDQRELTVHLAGHHPPLLLSGGTARELPGSYGLALGIAPGLGDWQPTRHAVPADSGLLLYTDGLIEGHAGSTPDAQRLGTPGLIGLIDAAGGATGDRLLSYLVDRARTLNAGRHSDDMALLQIRWP
ncbi:SpoIIE family protein phosphatase [Kitasatospora sp. NA04385]|uniref:PP2C family protein-serine/threonine phosphatase n=1 Tax=Kitasatospora sp. NA04385 TaxID=2742135 RepID=UPI0015914F2E|nr:SpoIIE family protein phosphatase [Kitasatospora sp. NA04385]QKW24076.1 SpoIIE family protein phosphatase [Kitasatospora sp. NA04385]